MQCAPVHHCMAGAPQSRPLRREVVVHETAHPSGPGERIHEAARALVENPPTPPDQPDCKRMIRDLKRMPPSSRPTCNWPCLSPALSIGKGRDGILDPGHRLAHGGLMAGEDLAQAFQERPEDRLGQRRGGELVGNVAAALLLAFEPHPCPFVGGLLLADVAPWAGRSPSSASLMTKS